MKEVHSFYNNNYLNQTWAWDTLKLKVKFVSQQKRLKILWKEKNSWPLIMWCYKKIHKNLLNRNSLWFKIPFFEAFFIIVSFLSFSRFLQLERNGKPFNSILEPFPTHSSNFSHTFLSFMKGVWSNIKREKIIKVGKLSYKYILQR